MKKENNPYIETKQAFLKATEDFRDNLPAVQNRLKALMREGNEKKDLYMIASADYWIAYTLFFKGRRRTVLSHVLKAYSLFSEMDDHDMTARYCNLLAVYYTMTGAYILAADYYHKLSEFMDSHEGLSITRKTLYCNIAENYYRMGDLKKAIRYGEKSQKEIQKEKKEINNDENHLLENYRLAFSVYGNLSEYYESAGRYEDALRNTLAMKLIMDKTGSAKLNEPARYKLRMASIGYSMGDVHQGNEYADIILAEEEAGVGIHEYGTDYENLAGKLIDIEDYDRALAFIKFLESYSEKTDLINDKISECRIKCKYYDAIGNQFETLNYSRRLNEYYAEKAAASLAEQLDIQEKSYTTMAEAGKLIKFAKENEKLAQTDVLTGLYNKVGAEKYMVPFCKKGGGGEFLLLDLDNFKLVNDLYGHAYGDEVLIAFAQILRGRCRSGDLLARVGGDEFVVAFESSAEEKVFAVFTDNINRQIRERCKEIMGDDFDVPIGISVGAADIPEEGADYDDLFKKADEALYRVKQNGRHGYCIHERGKSFSCDNFVDNDINHVMTLFEERGAAKEMMNIGREDFGVLYKYLARHNASSDADSFLIMFNLDKKENAGNIDRSAVAYKFEGILKNALTPGDVMTYGQRNSFLVMVGDTTGAEVKALTERIEKNWEATDESAAAGLRYSFRIIEK
ncbi:MAG: GGDEF domain-containing protein [Firmicutes bacterium]|nr:GGDEF domain-containing protein [Bacillota bacterium]